MTWKNKLAEFNLMAGVSEEALMHHKGVSHYDCWRPRECTARDQPLHSRIRNQAPGFQPKKSWRISAMVGGSPERIYVSYPNVSKSVISYTYRYDVPSNDLFSFCFRYEIKCSLHLRTITSYWFKETS